jgi:hypothetical protein
MRPADGLAGNHQIDRHLSSGRREPHFNLWRERKPSVQSERGDLREIMCNLLLVQQGVIAKPRDYRLCQPRKKAHRDQEAWRVSGPEQHFQIIQRHDVRAGRVVQDQERAVGGGRSGAPIPGPQTIRRIGP